MTKCHKWLNCSDLLVVHEKNIIGYGAVKDVFLAFWNNHIVACNKLRNEAYEKDLHHGLEMLIALNPNPNIVQLIGYCREKHIFITEYHRFNNAVAIKTLLSVYNQNSMKRRLELCINYAEILDYIHNSPVGVRVFCDSNDLQKLLSQLLVTDTFRLVLNDLDALPEVKNGEGIKCGTRKIMSEFAAPEQRWNRAEKFNEDVLPGYDEKTDIWKAAEVCDYFIQGPDYDVVQYMLFEIHKDCRNLDPKYRPSAFNLVNKYKEVLKEMNDHSEL
ncbi:hypothetical protein AAG570_007813 [Ranatra chinensis]|uniref:Protein O-mannose kinase n=1 Tax=Ranatra chinensis TaxID=642074 RepID=A0ABD0XWK4_9HEMI